MTSAHFFVSEEDIQNGIVIIRDEEHHHLSRVIRASTGDVVRLFSGRGCNYTARIKSIQRKQTILTIIEKHEPVQSPVKITLAQCLLKSRGWELVLQKVTELGVHRLIPLFSARTVVHLNDHVDKKVKRWQKITLEAAKQCGRLSLPEIAAPCTLAVFLKEEYESGKKIFLFEQGGRKLRDIIESGLKETSKTPSAVLLIGPEGGWTDGEAERISAAGFEAASLGPFVLRAETAAVSSVAILSHYWMT